MSAGLALAKADVTIPSGETLVDVSVLVNRGTNLGQIRLGRDVIHEFHATEVKMLTRKSWEVTTVDGQVYVAVKKGCGCGGSKR